MFDIGFWELIILFGLGLIILGPERLPKVAMKVGNWAGQARRMARQLSDQIRYEINDVDSAASPSVTPEAQPDPSWQRPGMDDLKPKSTDETTASSTDSNTDAAKGKTEE
ncbi:MAG: Sec-independent protein translocase protein TatB [Gammaproteobacteria bacterium]|nr:Sec-independent protein translocase protein TatB [Gammaproteobacteria bacterium]